MAGPLAAQTEAGEQTVGAADVEAAMLGAIRGGVHDGSPIPGCTVRVLQPERSPALNFCRWDGAGHFDLSGYPRPGPPTLGHIVSFLRLVDEATSSSPLTVYLTSCQQPAIGAVLAGAVLVLAGGCSAAQAWAEILKAMPVRRGKLGAWDRFPPPFDDHGVTTESSVSVLDCLAGLEAARDLGWLEDYRTFDLAAWELLRRKFDATWLIPGEMLCLGDPQVTARNPRFPGLLGAAGDDTERSRGWSSPSMPSTADTAPTDDTEPRTPRDFPPKQEVAQLRTDNFASYFVRQNIRNIFRTNFCWECQLTNALPASLAKVGVEVQHFEFKDGGVPTSLLVHQFLSVCEDKTGVFALHCKAGLGRTGVMAGAYAFKEHGVDGRAFHGWARLARPGTVQTPEQEKFLRAMRTGRASVAYEAEDRGSRMGCFARGL